MALFRAKRVITRAAACKLAPVPLLCHMLSRTLLLLWLVLSSVFCYAQDRNEKFNQYLDNLFAQSFDNIDTAYIAYPNQATVLIATTNKGMQANGYKVLGLLNLYRNKYTEAIRDLSQALQLDSACDICYIKLHWIYFYQKNNFAQCGKLRQLANRNMEKFVAGDTTAINRWAKLYRVYDLAPGKRNKAIEARLAYAARKMVDLDTTTAYYWWQYSLHVKGNEQEYALKKAVALEPAQAIYWNALAFYYAEQKDIEKLKQVFSNSKPSSAEDLHYWYQQKAHYLRQAGLVKEAAAVAKEARDKGMKIVY
jgi:hypothetical protein